MEFSEKLLEEINKMGIEIEGQIDFRTYETQRFSPKNSGSRKKPIFVILFSGGACFGDWRDSSTFKTIWEKPWKNTSLNEKLERTKNLLLFKREKQLLKEHALWRLKLLLSHKTWKGQTCTLPNINHPYLRYKKIKPYGNILQIRSSLVLLIHDIEDHLMSAQFIRSNGFKSFKKNAGAKHGMIKLRLLDPSHEGIIYICEGYATGCTIHEATNQPVVCSLGASNLVSVTKQIRQKYVRAEIKICADNDIFTKKKYWFRKSD